MIPRQKTCLGAELNGKACRAPSALLSASSLMTPGVPNGLYPGTVMYC